MSTIKDSGKRESFETGSRRDTREGKGRFDLLPPRAITRLAKHFEDGSKKYGDRNWEKGQPLSRYLDSAMRHLFKFSQGLRDEDHLIAAAWNLLCLAETEERLQEGELTAALDDLPGLKNFPNKEPRKFLSGWPIFFHVRPCKTDEAIVYISRSQDDYGVWVSNKPARPFWESTNPPSALTWAHGQGWIEISQGQAEVLTGKSNLLAALAN